MFWGSFSWDHKGPCHIWRPETKQEKEFAIKELETINKSLEPKMREEWELRTGISRLGLRNREGPKPIWRWSKKNGKLVRNGKGGVDWWRYQHHIILPKLIPFAEKCKEDRPDTIIQEDNAPAHAHHAQDAVWKAADIQRLLWPANSPDLNMIESCWAHMKRITTKKGAPVTRKKMEHAWLKAWEELDQARIQAWIARIPVHIQKVIELEGGNEYQEGIDS